jgi:endoglucanase
MSSVFRSLGIGLIALVLQACEGDPLTCQGQDQAYEKFVEDFVTSEGQVIDRGATPPHTTSEGQAYALFFALLANDRPQFDRILVWTEQHLAQGSLSAHLPAWEWGKSPSGQEEILDSNSASDADLWLSYTLLEAGRLWSDDELSDRGRHIAKLILSNETSELPNIGPTLLPGQTGFSEASASWRLNPSYLPPFILTRLTHVDDQGAWSSVRQSALSILSASQHGYAGDWLLYHRSTQFSPDLGTQGIGSYDAIRVYLWLGMTSPSDDFWKALPDRLHGMNDWLLSHELPPERVDIRTGDGSGTPSSGFSGALLPYLLRMGHSSKDAVYLQQEKIVRQGEGNPSYYAQALNIFGLGFTDGRFRFDREGKLEVAWSAGCKRR